MPKVSIVIVGYNSKNFLKECFSSIYHQTFKDFEVIFVDNNSTDGTVPFIKANFPQIELIENKQNVGFCKANNQAIELSRGDYILTLNCDVELDKDFIMNLIEEFNKHAEEDRVGMVSGKILRKDRKTIDSTGLILTRFRRFYDRGSGELNNGKFDKRKEIFGPCAAAALYKREMLKDIKVGKEYFDEDFFMFVEDVDLAWRANKRGWKALYVPEAVSYHKRHSNGYNKALIQYYSFRNRYFMLIKNERFRFFNIVSFLLYDIPRFFYILLTNRKASKAIFEMTKLTPLMLTKRKYLPVN